MDYIVAVGVSVIVSGIMLLAAKTWQPELENVLRKIETRGGRTGK